MRDPRASVAKAMAATAVWDNHACPPMDMADNLAFLPQIARYRDAGVSVLSLNVGYGEMDLEQHLRLLAQMRRWVLERPEAYRLITTVADVEAARRDGVLGVTFDVEGAAPLEGQVDLVDAFYALGVRWMLLAYNRANAFAGGCHDDDEGLTPAGAELLDRMAEVGMVACLSHTGRRAALQAMERASGPLIFSHSNPRALCDHPRNIDDDMIRACAETGGVIGVNGLALFLGGEGATAARAAEHIDYVVQRVGVAHAALGLDYVFDLDGLNAEKAAMAHTFPSGLGYEHQTQCVPPEAIPDIALALARRGYGEADLGAILGGNLARVAQAVWR